MPKQVRINGEVYSVPDNASMDQIQDYVASKGVKAPTTSVAKPADHPGLFRRAVNTVESFLPTPREAAGMAGAAIGGAGAAVPGIVTGPGDIAVAAAGGAAGYVGGAGIYDIVDQLITGKPKETGPLDTTSDLISGALQEGGGKFIAGKTASALERSIPKSVEKTVGASDVKDLFKINKVSGTLAEDFPVAASDKSLNKQLAQRVENLRGQLESEWSKLPQTTQIPTDETRIALEKERASLRNANGTLVHGAEAIEKELTGMIDYLKQNPTMTPADFRNNRQLWDEFIKHSRLPFGDASIAPDKEQVYKLAADNFRSTIGRMFPKIAGLNEKISAYIPASDIVNKRVVKEGASGLMENIRRAWPEIIGAGAGTFLGPTVGLSSQEGAALGGATVALRQVMNSTAWQTASIPVKKQVVELLKKGMTQEAIGLLMGQTTQILTNGTTVNTKTGDVKVPPENRRDALQTLGRPTP